jgi:hypothetical protein
VDAGSPSGAGLSGTVLVGDTNAEAVEIGRTTKRSTIHGPLGILQSFFGTDSQLLFINSPYLAKNTDFILRWTTTGGACAQTLPDITTVQGQFLYIVKETADANAVTITPFVGNTVNAAPTLVLAGGATRAALLYAPLGGLNWIVLSNL